MVTSLLGMVDYSRRHREVKQKNVCRFSAAKSDSCIGVVYRNRYFDTVSPVETV